MTETTAATTAAPRGGQEAEQPDPNRWLALACVLTAAFMVLLDISIVNVAIPSIQSNLHASFGEVQLVLAGYQLAYALVLITGGRLGDIHGRKRLFMVGMAGFVLASALCGFAQNPTMLVASRVLQGLMAALMYPQVLSVIQVSFPPRERGKAFGIFGATIGIATITGPLAGGLIIRDDITGGAWRWVFLVNLPIGIASLLFARRFLRESRAPHANRLDLAGVGLVSVGLGMLVYPLVEGRDQGWPLWCYLLLVASPVVLGGFVLFERGRQNASPLVRLDLFHNRAFSAGLLFSFFFFAGVPAFFFTMSLMMQIGLGFSALHAGLTTMPFAIGSAVASAMSVRLAPKLGRTILAFGAGLLVLAVIGMIVTIDAAGRNLTSLELLPSFLVGGLGLGTTVAPALNIILAAVPGRDAGSASGMLTTVQQVGGAMGVAVIGVILFTLLGSRADSVAAQVAPELRAGAVQAGAPPAAADSLVQQFTRCFDDRSNAKDPTETPPSCNVQVTGSAVGGVVQGVAGEALAVNFTGAQALTLLFCGGVWTVTGLLVLALPRARPSGPPGATAGAH